MKLRLLFAVSVMLSIIILSIKPSETIPESAQDTMRGSLAMILEEQPVSVSEILGSLYRVAVNKATPQEELLFSHLTVLVDSLTVLKNSMESEKSGFYADMLNGLMGKTEAQKRLAARSVDKFLEVYLEQQLLGWSQEKKSDGTPLYSKAQLKEFKTTTLTARIKRIITGEATRTERIAFWLVAKCKNIVSKIRSWAGGSKLGATTEASALAAVVAETFSDRALQFKEGSKQLLNALTDKATQAKEFAIEQTQKGIKATIEGIDYVVSKTKEGGSFAIEATLQGKNYILQQAADAQNFALSLVGLNGTIQHLEEIKIGKLESTEITAIGKMTELSLTQKTINAVSEKITALTVASTTTAQKIISDISDNVTHVETAVQETLANAHKTLETAWNATQEKVRSTVNNVSDAWAGFTSVLSLVIADPSILLSRPSASVMELATATSPLKEENIDEDFFISLEFQTTELAEMFGTKALESTSFEEFSENLGTTIESLEKHLKTQFNDATTKAILDLIENRVEATTLRKIPPTDFQRFTPSVQEQIFDAWRTATPEELVTLEAAHYKLFPEDIIQKVYQAIDHQQVTGQKSLKEKMLNELLTTQKAEPTRVENPRSLETLEDEDKDEVFEDALDTGILDYQEQLTQKEAPESLRDQASERERNIEKKRSEQEELKRRKQTEEAKRKSEKERYEKETRERSKRVEGEVGK